MNKKICYWSISWGDYSYMTQGLIKSMRDFGVKDDFVSFSDKKLIGCINQELDKKINLDLKSYMFKFDYLQKMRDYNYDYFIFIDADSIFVREPDGPLLDLIKDQCPWHSFLESPINSRLTNRPDWWGVKNQYIVKIFRELGVLSREIRNTNAGFWIVKKDFIQEACDLGNFCYKYFIKNNFKITEEIPMAYISNYMSPDNYYRYIENNKNYWCSDWTGVFKNKMPENIKWTSTSYMTGEFLSVNPFIIHGMRSKNILIKNGKEILIKNEL